MRNLELKIFTLPWFSLLIVLFVYFPLTAESQAAHGKILLALSKTDRTLSMVDPVNFKILSQIPVGSDPHEVIASSDGRTAFVTIYGGGSLHEMDVIDLVNKKSLAAFDTRPLYGPHGLVFAGGKVWFTTEGSKSVGRYDPESGKLDWSMGTGQDRTHMIYVTPDTKSIYTTNVSSGTVSILIDTLIASFPGSKPHEDWVQYIIPTARGSEGFDVSPDGTELWTASGMDGTISVIDLIHRNLSARIDARVMGANRLKFTPDGKSVLISSLQSGELTIFDSQSRKEVKRLKLGHGAAGILMDPDGTRAFVACTPDNEVVIVEMKTLQVTDRFKLGGPDGLAWTIQK